MAYVSVESDDRLEEGPEGLEFKSFLGTTNASSGNAGSGTSGSAANVNRGFLADQPGKSSSSRFWDVEYYQDYFDVDTKTVLTRCYSTLLPNSSNYLSTHLQPSPDLYGPFWTLTTLILTLFLSSSLAASITAYLSPTTPEYDYDFTLLSVGVTLVYAYGLALPVAIWLALRYMGVGEWSVVEAVALWGYGQFVWIPVSILCVIPIPIVRWVLVGLAFLLSGYFLVINTYPILASSEHKYMRGLIVVVAILHAGLALTFKVLFFSYYVVSEIGTKDPIGEDPVANATTTAAAMLIRSVLSA